MEKFGDVLAYNSYKVMDLIAQEDYEKITWPKRIKMTGRISCC